MNKKLHLLPAFSVKALSLLCFLLPAYGISQIDTTVSLTFDFNDHEIKEIDNKVDIFPVGVFLTNDRFGNEKSALQLVGANHSYLNLGTSHLFKNPNMSISLWAKINAPVLEGRGDKYNPLLIIKNKEGFDFINAISLSYDITTGYIGTNCTKDSFEEVMVIDKDPIDLNKWYHFVIVCNNSYLAFYKNGELSGKSKKKFETKFLQSDSLVIGHSASTKNHRFSRLVVDDIKIFHRSLSPKEVADLYKEPNPNAFGRMLSEALKYILVILGLVVIIVVLIIRNRLVLKKQKHESELAIKMTELELKALKSQMNPHFMSNSLAAIQELNYNQDKEKAGLYIAKFSYFLRQILNYSQENYISISEEVVMIRLFVELEQLRFKNGFTFELITDEDCNIDDVLIPSLITQPFIENAIWHGLLPLKNSREPKLSIRIMELDGYPTLEIEDNGVGRGHESEPARKSKGTHLVIDKIDALNRLSKTSNYRINILDLMDNEGNKSGTKIVIQLDNIKD